MPGMHWSTYFALDEIRTKFPEHVQGPATDLYLLLEDFDVYTLFLWVLPGFGALLFAWFASPILSVEVPLAARIMVLLSFPVIGYLLSWTLLRWLYFEKKRASKAEEIRKQCAKDPLYKEAISYLRSNSKIDRRCRSYQIV